MEAQMVDSRLGLYNSLFCFPLRQDADSYI